MIPDKIYLPKEEIEERMPWIATPYEDDPNWDECYIRKEALLEWLESKIKDASNGGFVNGLITFAYKDVVEHINGM